MRCCIGFPSVNLFVHIKFRYARRGKCSVLIFYIIQLLRLWRVNDFSAVVLRSHPRLIIPIYSSHIQVIISCCLSLFRPVSIKTLKLTYVKSVTVHRGSHKNRIHESAPFPAVVEHHFTLGGSYKITDRLGLDLALETVLNKKLEASNPSLLQSEFSSPTSELSTLLGHISFTWNF